MTAALVPPPVPWPIVALGAALGLVLGSFLNVCIVRWPARESVVRPRSRCPQCGNPIAWYDNVPVLSWVLLRARCRHCGLPIPWRYPAVELAVGVIWAAALLHDGVSVEALRAAVFGTILLGIAVSDAREYIIPDEFSVGGTVLGVALALAGGALPWPQALLGAAVGFLLLWLVAIAGAKLFGQDAMGGGDIKMMAMIGAFLGWQGVLLSLFLGAALGTVIFLPFKLLGREKLVPFGVFLALGAAACWIAGPAIIDWYRGVILG